MDIDQRTFHRQLLPILKSIANAAFVSFDFEMSGISAKSKYGAGDRSHNIGKPSLQQQYEEMKEAAETFQILQVGICCVEEDRERDYYLARPYNFYLTPLEGDGIDLKLERNFEFSASACGFLYKNKFDFGKVFSQGVPYLSRYEEAGIRKREEQRANQTATIPDVVLNPGSPELEFYRAARTKISTWVHDPKPTATFVNIGEQDQDLNAFQRRLVYQLVRSEFPGYRVQARMNRAFMQIEKLDLEQEAKFQARRAEGLNKRIAKQIGLRWIFEALSNGSLDSIPIEWFTSDTSEKPELQKPAVELAWKNLKKTLMEKSHIIVGHNLFMDLGFLYATFFGPLPQEVTDFQVTMRGLFPTVFDTKFINTEGQNSMGGRGRLQEILEPFRQIHLPLIVLHEDHTAYGASLSREHEAGFDSWMTAELFVKMSSQLYAERKHLIDDRDTDEESDTAAEDLSYSADDDEPGGVLLTLADDSKASNTLMGDDLPPAWHERQLQGLATNRFTTLMDLGEALPGVPQDPKPKQWIPSFENSFWDLYMNKLRVNAAEVGVCDLDSDD